MAERIGWALCGAFLMAASLALCAIELASNSHLPF